MFILIRICVVSAAVISLVQCRSLQTFYFNNTCGCWSDDMFTDIEACSIIKPNCLSEGQTLSFEVFESDNTDCSEWFLQGYSLSLIDLRSGTYNISLVLSSFTGRLRYRIDMKILDNANGNDTVLPLFPNHSSRNVELQGTSCDSVLQVQFSYLYTGRYQLEVGLESGPHVSQDLKCRSKPFQLNNSYRMRKLSDIKPYATSRYRAQQRELVFNSNFGSFPAGHHPYGIILTLKSNIDMTLIDCAGSGNEIAKYFMSNKHEQSVGCCDCYQQAGEVEGCRRNLGEALCPCTWVDQVLKCTFSNVSNGNYCVVLELVDDRCKYDTIWVKESPCRWSYNESIKEVASYPPWEGRLAHTPASSSRLQWFIFLPLIILALLFSLLLLYRLQPRCLKKLSHDLSAYSPSSLLSAVREGTGSSMSSQRHQSSGISWLIQDETEKFIEPEVLLLYPRDCQTFMAAITAFRTHLKSLHFKVYDPLDEDLYDEVAASYETWSLPFIKNKNMKILLVLSQIAKRYEKAFLDGGSVEYAAARAFDRVYPLSLSAIHQYFSKRFDSYQRIFVVQLEGSPPMTFDFITPATVYSIPKNLSALLSDLTGGKVKGAGSSYPLTAFRDAAADFECFCAENENYLAEILSDEKLTQS